MRYLLKITTISAAALAVLSVAPAGFAQDRLEIQNFIGTIHWSNGPLSVEVQKNVGETKITRRDVITIDGGHIDIDGSKCKSSYGRYDLNLFGKKKEGQFGGYKGIENMPVLNITLPENAVLNLRDSVVFTDGSPHLAAADIKLSHCGKLSLGDVSGRLALDSRGSADVVVGNTGQIVANLKGSGDLTGAASHEVLIESHGSADIELAELTSLESSIYGSGDLYTKDIKGSVDLTSHGSGDIVLGHVVGDVSFFGHGSGDFEVVSVVGRALELSSHGSGDVEIGGGQVDNLAAKVRGSASLEFSGQTKTAHLITSGSGDIYVQRVTGVVSTKSSGSGEIEIGERR